MSCPSQSEYQPCNSKFLLIISWTREFIRSKKLYGSVRCRLLFFCFGSDRVPRVLGHPNPRPNSSLHAKKLKMFRPSGDFCFFLQFFLRFPVFFLSHPSPQFFQTLKTPNPKTFWKISKNPRGVCIFLSRPVPRPNSPSHPCKKKQYIELSTVGYQVDVTVPTPYS